MRRFRLLLLAVAGVVVIQTTATAALAMMTAFPLHSSLRDTATPSYAVLRLSRGRRRIIAVLRAPLLLPTALPTLAASAASDVEVPAAPSYHSADSPPPDHPPA